MHNSKLSALVGSRICHDLISPIGAISNGLELLNLTNTSSTPEMQLISDSVQNANARIRFFRVAYGKAAPDQTFSRHEAIDILSNMYNMGRHKVSWLISEDQPRDIMCALFLAIQCLETGLPLGGEIKVMHDQGQWSLHAEGRRILQDESLWAHITSQEVTGELQASHVHFILLNNALKSCEKTATIDCNSTNITISF